MKRYRAVIEWGNGWPWVIQVSEDGVVWMEVDGGNGANFDDATDAAWGCLVTMGME